MLYIFVFILFSGIAKSNLFCVTYYCDKKCNKKMIKTQGLTCNTEKHKKKKIKNFTKMLFRKIIILFYIYYQ